MKKLRFITMNELLYKVRGEPVVDGVAIIHHDSNFSTPDRYNFTLYRGEISSSGGRYFDGLMDTITILSGAARIVRQNGEIILTSNNCTWKIVYKFGKTTITEIIES